MKVGARFRSSIHLVQKDTHFQKYLGRANTLLWYVRSSEGLAFGLKPASITDLYHGEAFRVSKIMNFQG